METEVVNISQLWFLCASLFLFYAIVLETCLSWLVSDYCYGLNQYENSGNQHILMDIGTLLILVMIILGIKTLGRMPSVVVELIQDRVVMDS